jgi:hypothetical protein
VLDSCGNDDGLRCHGCGKAMVVDSSPLHIDAVKRIHELCILLDHYSIYLHHI